MPCNSSGGLTELLDVLVLLAFYLSTAFNTISASEATVGRFHNPKRQQGRSDLLLAEIQEVTFDLALANVNQV